MELPSLEDFPDDMQESRLTGPRRGRTIAA